MLKIGTAYLQNALTHNPMCLKTHNSRLTRGVATPLTGFFPRSLQNAKESDLGHNIANLFYILCGHFDEKKMGVPPYPG